MENCTPASLPDEELERLREQIRAVDKLLGTSILPESMGDEVLDLSRDDLKTIFRTRYSAFFESLKTVEDKGESNEETQKTASFIAALNNLDRYISSYTQSDSRTLRPHQFEAFKKLRNFLEEGGKDGYFKLPTGYGKTVLFIEFLEALGLKTLIVAPTQPLVEQTQQKMGEFAEEVDAGLVYAWAKEMGKDVTITTYDSFIRKVKKGEFKPTDYDCLILDEVHRALSDPRMEAINKFKHAIRLGFTATPYYSKVKNVAQLLPHEIDRLDIKDAIDEGMLSSVRVVLAKTDIDLAGVGTSGDDYNRRDLAKTVNIKSRNRAAVEYYKKHFEGSSAICYCAGIQHAKDVAEAFIEAGVYAAFISGKSSPEKKEKILKAHHSGAIKVVCNADLLVEGYDEPAIEVCMNLRPTFSYVFAEQRAGRAVRLDSNNSEKVATIVDFIDNNSGSRPFTYPVSFVEILQKVQALNKQHKEEGVEMETFEEEIIEGVRFISDPTKVTETLGKRPIRMKKQRPIQKKRWIDEKFLEEERKMIEDGWLTVAMVAEELDINTRKTERIGIDVSKRAPDLTTILKRITSGKARKEVSVSFFRPEILPHMRKAIEENTAPEGWLNRMRLFKEYALTGVEIDLFFKRFKHLAAIDQHGKYLFPDEKPRKYYAPELAEKMAVEMHREIPVGWISLSQLAWRLGMGRNKLKPIAEGIAQKTFLAREEGKNRDLYYDPEMAEEIARSVMEQSLIHTEIRQVAGRYQTNLAQVRIALNHVQLTRPAVKVQDRNNKKIKLEYLLKEDVPKLKPFLTMEKGWKSLNEVAEDIGTNLRFVRRAFELAKPEMPKQFHYLISRSEVDMAIYVSPLMAQEIKKGIESLKQKKGWKTTREISLDSGIARNEVRFLLREAGGGVAERQTFINEQGLMKPYYPPDAVKYVMKKARVIKTWPTVESLANELGEAEPRIRKLAVCCQIDYPSRLVFASNGSQMRLNPEIIGTIREYCKKGEGWLDITEYLGNSQIGYERMLSLFKGVEKEHPELFRWAIGDRGKRTMRILPEAISLINVHLAEMFRWIPEKKLAKDLELMMPELETIKRHCTGNDPEQTLSIYKRKQIVNTLVAPELEAKIREIMEIPEGWVTRDSIIDKYDLQKNDLELFLKDLRTRYPEKVKVCWHRIKKCICEFFDPSVLETIETDAVEDAPEDWQTAQEIMEEFGIDDLHLENLLGVCVPRSQKNELARKYRSGSGKIQVYYAPRVVEAMANKLPAPRNWMTYAELAENNICHPRIIKELADSLGARYPRWQKKFFDPEAGHEKTYMHPKLIERIEMKL